MLHRYQTSFRANHSTATCLPQITDIILNGRKNELRTGMTFNWSSKGFWHRIRQNEVQRLQKSTQKSRNFGTPLPPYTRPYKISFNRPLFWTSLGLFGYNSCQVVVSYNKLHSRILERRPKIWSHTFIVFLSKLLT